MTQNEHEFIYRNHWLAKRKDSPYWYICWRMPGSTRTYRKTTRSTDLDVAKELLIGFAGAGESTRPEGPAWFRMEDALMLYARHMERRPSYKMVCWTCDILADFCKRHDILYATQFTLDRQDTYIRERSLEIKRHKGSVSNATLNRELGTLRTALHFAWKCGRLSHEPYVQLLPEPPPRERVLTPEECRRLMEVSRRWPHLYLFIRLALFTLQRMTAILRLTVEQVDLTHSRINFHPPGEPITSKRYAVVPIAHTIWGEVAQAVEDSQSGYVVEYRGEPVTSVKSAMRAASKAAGIKTVTPQVLRRTAATLLAGAGVPMREIAGMLGHTQIRTTERYAQHSPEYLKHAANTLDDLMG